MPLARPVRSVPQDVVYGLARIDASGRICERAVITALGWADGDRLTLTAEAGVVTVRRDPGGMVTLPASDYITIPAALRRRCGLEAGNQVLLAALPAGVQVPLGPALHGDDAGRVAVAVIAERPGSHVEALQQRRVGHRRVELVGRN